MGDLIRKSNNVSILMYHFVCVAKYRRLVITEEVDAVLKDTCIEISKRYEMHFLEIGTEGDHGYFLIQSVPLYSPTKIVTKVKSIIARQVFASVPSVKKQLWAVNFGPTVTLSRQLANMQMKTSFANTSEIKANMVNINNCTNKKLFTNSWSYFDPDTPSACGGVVYL